ncbi:MAG: restriction endonuclease subunit S [Treponema sp.]|nr:MAG: restriction endonuclease subunit S [Treponema sp.]
MGELVYNHGQKTPEQEFSYIDIGSINNEHQKLNEKENFIQPDKAPSRARKIVKFGDVIYSTVRPYLHNMCIIDKEFTKEPIASTGFAVMTSFPGLLNKYLFYYLLSPTFDNYANDTDNAKGVAYPAINDDKLYKGIVPLPPLSEQKRIVAAIEKFMPLIEEYGKKETQLKAINEKIGTLTKKAILQEAVQGKLVPQIAAEGNAKDLLEEIRKERLLHGLDFANAKSGKKKSKKETALAGSNPCDITEDEIPFDIPESWCWCRITDIATCELGKTKDALKNKGEMKDYLCSINIQEEGIDLSKVKQMKFEESEYERYTVKKNDLLICEGGDAGRCAIYDRDEPMYYQNALHRVRFFYNLNPKFYLYVFQVYKANKILTEVSKGVTIQHLTGAALKELYFPLPPLAEQKRIVAAIEKLLPLCEKLGE